MQVTLAFGNLGVAMDDRERRTPDGTTRGPVKDSIPPPTRQERLGAALRANLRRRKAQSRGRSKETGGKDGDGPD